MWMEAIARLGGLAAEPGALATALVGTMGVAIRQRRLHVGERLHAARLQEELMAYMQLDEWRGGDARAMGKRVCRAISRHSAFGMAALLTRDSRGRLTVTASIRTDELTVCALERWAETKERRQHERGGSGYVTPSHGRRVHLVRLERRAGYKPGDPAALAWCTALIVPMTSENGSMAGAIAVCADRYHGRPSGALEGAMRPLEALAARFASSFATRQVGEQRTCVVEMRVPVLGRLGATHQSMPTRAAERAKEHGAGWAGAPGGDVASGSLTGVRSAERHVGVSATGHA